MTETWTLGGSRSLVRAFVELADTLTEDYDVSEFLYGLLLRCTVLFDVQAAGVMLRNPHGGIELAAASSETSELVELFQLQSSIGPCLDCLATGVPVRSGDLLADQDRWPGWAQVALGAGFRSAYATPMALRSESIGAFNLFGTGVDALGPGDLAAVQGLADVATIGILQERAIHRADTLSGQLQHALDSRILIEQAKGIIAGRTELGLSMERAFLLMRDHARRTNRKLSLVSQEIITGRLAPTELLGARRGETGDHPSAH